MAWQPAGRTRTQEAGRYRKQDATEPGKEWGDGCATQIVTACLRLRDRVLLPGTRKTRAWLWNSTSVSANGSNKRIVTQRLMTCGNSEKQNEIVPHASLLASCWSAGSAARVWRMLRLMRLVRSMSKNSPSSAVAAHSSSAGSSRSVKIRGTPEQATNGLHAFQNPMQS